jgi:hypothetical protein
MPHSTTAQVSCGDNAAVMRGIPDQMAGLKASQDMARTELLDKLTGGLAGLEAKLTEKINKANTSVREMAAEAAKQVGCTVLVYEVLYAAPHLVCYSDLQCSQVKLTEKMNKANTSVR